jgi:hypothetical protein
MASYALSGAAAEESLPRGSLRDAHRDESSLTERIPGAQSAEALSVAGHDPEHLQSANLRSSGQLINQVTFGFGLLGRIDSGTLEFERVEVGPQQWKTAFINIHFSGRAVILKTVNKDQYERRSDFRAVSSDLSLSDARDLLITRTLPLPQTAQTSN